LLLAGCATPDGIASNALRIQRTIDAMSVGESRLGSGGDRSKGRMIFLEPLEAVAADPT
jgi:hypothetical protein